MAEADEPAHSVLRVWDAVARCDRHLGVGYSWCSYAAQRSSVDDHSIDSSIDFRLALRIACHDHSVGSFEDDVLRVEVLAGVVVVDSGAHVAVGHAACVAKRLLLPRVRSGRLDKDVR